MDVMLDLETLSTQPNAAIVSIAMVAFDPQGSGVDNTVRPFFEVVDFSTIPEHRHIDPATVQWWMHQSSEAIAALFPDDIPDNFNSDHYLSVLGHAWMWLRALYPHRDGNPVIWAYGPQFDCVILRSAFRGMEYEIPWSYQDERDVRTLLRLVGTEVPEMKSAHNPLADCVAQVHAVQDAHGWVVNQSSDVWQAASQTQVLMTVLRNLRDANVKTHASDLTQAPASP